MVSGDRVAQRIGQGYGATVVEDDERGHNSAAKKGIAAALEDGIERALLVPGDCPLMDPKELEELLVHPAGERSALIVPDRHGTGTNALLLAPPDVLAPSFGPDSRRRHMADADAAGVPAEVVEVPCLALDVDTPDDLEALQRHLTRTHGGAAHTRGMLNQLHASPVASQWPPSIDQRHRDRGTSGDRAGRRSRQPHRNGDHRRPRPPNQNHRRRRAGDRAQGRVQVRGPDPPPRRRRSRDHARSSSPTQLGKDPRHVQVVLDESREVLRASHGVLICVTHHGFVCANAGVDASNVPGEDALVLLPRDPDASARHLRTRISQRRLGANPAILITDSFGRAWRHGQVDVAIGCAGLTPLEDWRGRTDAVGRELKATWIAVADELAAAADLARTKDGALPVIVVRGADRHVSADDGPGAAAMIRPESRGPVPVARARPAPSR